MNKPPTVYVVYNDTRRDLSPSEKFGQTRLMFGGRVDYGLAVEHARKMLHDFDPDQDYILMIGDPALIGITMIAALEYAPKERITVLRWDRRALQYTPETFDFTMPQEAMSDQ
jgi:hypothetical protein